MRLFTICRQMSAVSVLRTTGVKISAGMEDDFILVARFKR
jgi:hypothetical protein